MFQRSLWDGSRIGERKKTVISNAEKKDGEIGKVDIQIDATCEVVEKDITIAPGEEEPLPEPEPRR